MTTSDTASAIRTHRFAHALLRCVCAVVLVLAAAPAIAQSICERPGSGDWSDWLDRQEAAGGHAEACHLNVSVNGLIGRIEDRGGHKGPACLPGAAASVWSQRKLLLDAIKPAIIQDGARFAQGAPGNHIINGSAGATIGTIVTAYAGSNPGKNRSPCPGNRKYVCSDAIKWLAIVRKTPTGACYLLTAYPTP